MIARNLRIIALIALLISSAYAGETGKIAGTIIDKETREAMPGANVIVNASWINGEEIPLTQLYGASSDIDGTYFIINMPPGEYTLEVVFIGYATARVTNVRVQVDKTTRVDFELSSETITGDEVEVVAFKPEAVEKDLTATKVNYDIPNLRDLPGIRGVDDVLNLQADVEDGHFRGSREGEAAYLINGSSIVNPLNNARSFEPITIGLQEVEVYTSGFSAEYGNVQSGVVNMVAREGRADKWETNFDASVTNSRYKTFGGSVFSEDYNQYFRQLNSTEEWAFGTDPISGVLLWSHFGLGFDRYLPEAPVVFPPQPISREDSMRTAELVRILWLQSVRQVGLEYDKPDYRVEFSGSGPIAKNTTLFVAAQQNTSQPILPTGRANVARQLTSNITIRPNVNNKIQIIYNYDNGFDNGITANYFRWFENIMNVAKETQSTHQFGLNWNHVLNNKTFLDIKLSQLFTNFEDKVDMLGDSTFTELYTNSINWRDYTAPTGYQAGKIETTTGQEKSQTFALSGTISSQLNKNNLLKAGVQFNYFDLDVDFLRSRSNLSQVRLENYNVNPYEGAIYIQDKLEYEGLIANLGMRFDFYNFNTEYFTDKFSPYRNPNFDPSDPSQGGFYDEELASKEKTKLETFFQPRIGISFPVSVKAVLHMNYGVFTQRPAFERVYGTRLKFDANPNYDWLGNPQLKAEQTIAYDVGLVYALPGGFNLDVSAYLKDVSNLLQFAIYEDNGGVRYFTFDNREYANIKGFQVNLKKNLGVMRWYVSYNWESAKGKSGSAIGSGARAEFFESDERDDLLPSPRDVFLDYNRLHKLVTNLTVTTPRQYGILGDILLSGTYRFSSGRPFTYDPSGMGLQMNQRTPDEHDLRARLQKSIRFNNSSSLKIYAEVFNLINQQVFSYTRTFEDPQGTQNVFKQRFVEDRENVLTQPEFAPYVTSLDAYLISSQPRSFRFGLELGF